VVGGDTGPREDRVFDNGGCNNHGSKAAMGELLLLGHLLFDTRIANATIPPYTLALTQTSFL